MSANQIGLIACADCGFADVPLKETSKRQWATYTCPECKSQHFARSELSNEKMRARARLDNAAIEEETIEEETINGEVIDHDAAALAAIEEENIEEESGEEKTDDNSGATYWS